MPVKVNKSKFVCAGVLSHKEESAGNACGNSYTVTDQQIDPRTASVMIYYNPGPENYPQHHWYEPPHMRQKKTAR